MKQENNAHEKIIVRGARVHNLKNIDVEVPLNKLTAICGVSGSGKSSLALGVLYAEGSRRYLDALSAYTRRRLTQAAEAKIDSIENIPAALALHQRPGIPGVRSTFGTMTELSNSLRLLFSRLGSHVCPNGHRLEPTVDIALDKPLVCPVCGISFPAPSAESFSFNSSGACMNCGGTGIVRTVDETTLVPDESLTIDEGAVAPWNSLMWSLMTDVCREMGVRTNVPFSELTEKERDIVFHGAAEKKHILYKAKSSNQAAEMDFTYYSAVYTVENALAKVKDEKGMKRVEKFLKQDICPECGGSRLKKEARLTKVCGKTLPEVLALPLDELTKWVCHVPDQYPAALKEMAQSIAGQLIRTAIRLQELGLGYLSPDREGATLSTGERQRVQLARAVRNNTTGVLYVLDEPSIGLHPVNVDGLLHIIKDLVAYGNTVVLVDHDIRVLRVADYMIEIGAGAGEHGGNVVARGSVEDVERNPDSLIGYFLNGMEQTIVREQTPADKLFDKGKIVLKTKPLHTVHALDLQIPKGRLTVVTGVSGSGKTTMILESLVPALQSIVSGEKLPEHIVEISTGGNLSGNISGDTDGNISGNISDDSRGIKRVNLIDAAPIGANVRSTVATYSNVLDDLRKLFAKSDAAKEQKLKASDFSYNTGSLRCPSCDGTGQITMDVQFLPDVEIACPECNGRRYAKSAQKITYQPKKSHKGYSISDFMEMTVETALSVMKEVKNVRGRLETLCDLGLGYLTLGEATPLLSGGEAQRLKLASEMGKSQKDTLFVFDEPTIGLHPKDVRALIDVFQTLLDNGATVVVIEHDLDMIANADYIIDMGPGGGNAGGRIVAMGTPQEIAQNQDSVTGRYLHDIGRGKI
ncbi:MAG: excinuclease ABC subunit UvrA [Blautia sp.]|nr:excinuclease ABC subunit UvrA [Lachnoclostridium sp.]MCM1212307.1 excinuclease ABC subunit UvrA [Blautia sp.]